MDAIQESLNAMMSMFTKRMDAFEERQVSRPSTPTSEDDNLMQEFTLFKSFVLTSLRALQSQIEVLAKQGDQLEMRGRRKILLLHGVREEPHEDTNIVVAKVLVDRLQLSGFTVGDINRSHRMGRAESIDRPRPILLKLRDVDVRKQIWSSKSALKGSGLTLSEFLTKARHDVFMAARKRFGITKCWSREGYVFVLGPDGTRHRVCYMTDLDSILAKEKPKPVPVAVAGPSTAPAIRAAIAQAAVTKPRRVGKK